MANSKSKPQGTGLRAAARAVQAQGRNGDTVLAHINPREAAMLKQAGGVGTRNPKTGLRQYYDSDSESNYSGGVDLADAYSSGGPSTGVYGGAVQIGDQTVAGGAQRSNFGRAVDFMNNNKFATGVVPGGALVAGLSNKVDKNSSLGWQGGNNPGSSQGELGGNGFSGPPDPDSLPWYQRPTAGAGGGTGAGTGAGSPVDWAHDLINIKDPAELATYISNAAWNNWIADKKDLDAAATTIGTRGDSAYTNADTMRSNLVSDYDTYLRPATKDYATYVNRLGTESYRADQRARAMADVQGAHSNAMGQGMRAMQRSGVAPGSGRYQAMLASSAPGLAAQMAGAAMKAENLAYDNWGKGLQDLNSMGQKNLDAAKGWSEYGLKAGQSGFLADLDVAKMTNQNTGTAGQVAGTAANALYKSQELAQKQSQYDDEHSWGNVFGSALAGGAAKWLFS